MNPISAFFVRNIIPVFFFYGLAFFVMGLALALASRRTSEFRFAQAIVPLALFGILHGIHEWVEMFQKVGSLTTGYTPGVTDEVLRLLLLVASFMALMAFGLVLLSPERLRTRLLVAALVAMLLVWLASVVVTSIALQSTVEQTLAQADVLARYSLGIPAALVGAWALMAQQRTFREYDMPQFGRDLVWVTTALLLYGVVGQFFVRETLIVPSNLVNSTLFLQLFGVPVQLFRGAMAAVMAVFMLRALNAFELENRRRLAMANQAKLDAQAEALAAERRIGQERERLNADLRRTAQELALLLELSNVLAMPMELQDRLRSALQRLVNSIEFADAGLVLLRQIGNDGVETSVSMGFDNGNGDQWLESARDLGVMGTDRGMVMCRHRDGTTMAVPFGEAMEEPRCHLQPSPTVMISLPLLVEQKVIGSIVLAQSGTSGYRGLSQPELELLIGIARQLSLSIENARLYQAAQEHERVLGEMLRQVVGAQEAERQRIARELHDATGQSLTAISLGLRGVETMLGQADPAKLSDQIAELRTYSTNALGELRSIIADLRPSILDDMGLAAALKWYVQGFERRRGIATTLEVTGTTVRLPAEIETVLFRVTQEALTNVAKHAEASSVTVRLDYTPTQVTLTIADDGSGFDIHKILRNGEQPPGWGLLDIQERAALVGGTYRIDSQPGQGTSVQIALPLKPEVPEVDHDQDQVAVG
jgi:signal transduction histidine kinase